MGSYYIDMATNYSGNGDRNRFMQRIKETVDMEPDTLQEDIFENISTSVNPLSTRPTPTTSATTTTESSSPSTTSSTNSSTTTTTNTTPSTTTTTPAQGPEHMSNLMAHMMSMMAQGNVSQLPEQRYATQLDQMAAIGFVDREYNLRALTATLGNVNAAIGRILSNS